MKFKLLSYLFVFSLLSIVTITSCGDDMDDCETADLTYTNYAKGIIDSSCGNSSCHGAGTAATFPMSDYASTSAAVGFDRIIGAINHTDGFSPMPKGGTKLDDCDISKLTQWINDGAPE